MGTVGSVILIVTIAVVLLCAVIFLTKKRKK